MSDEIVPHKNLGAAPQPLRGAERNSPAPPRGAFHLRADLGGRPQHTPGVPLVPTFSGQAQAPRDRPGSLLSGEPRVTRAAVLRDTSIPGGTGQLGAIQSVAQSFGVELRPIGVSDVGEIERAIAAFARSPNGGLIVTASVVANVHRDLLTTLAARHRLPAVYSDRVFVTGGGLISYGPDRVDQYRRAAAYVDRILKGEKPADLPVQAPTKYELVINLKTAKALGLEVPHSLLTRADEVIE